MKLTLTFGKTLTEEEKLTQALLDTKCLEALARSISEIEMPRDFRLKRFALVLTVLFGYLSLIAIIFMALR